MPSSFAVVCLLTHPKQPQYAVSQAFLCRFDRMGETHRWGVRYSFLPWYSPNRLPFASFLLLPYLCNPPLLAVYVSHAVDMTKREWRVNGLHLII